MVVLQLLTQLMNALVGSNTNLGKKCLKQCNYYAKNDDATVKCVGLKKISGSDLDRLIAGRSLLSNSDEYIKTLELDCSGRMIVVVSL